MVKRIAPVAVVACMLLAACGAVCQNAGQSLPDAPSVQAATQVQRYSGFLEAGSPWGFEATSGLASALRQGKFSFSAKTAFRENESENIFLKYLHPTLPKQQSGYHTASGGSLIDRATYAASRVFVTRDDSGKGRLNTSYFLRTLISVAADTGSRPYWRRSVTDPFSDFGSMVGNDAGMSVLHEFEPGILQTMKGHTPKIVSRIERRISH